LRRHSQTATHHDQGETITAIPPADGNTVVVRNRKGEELWSHGLTGAPLIDYVPAQAFQMVDSGEATISVENTDTAAMQGFRKHETEMTEGSK